MIAWLLSFVGRCDHRRYTFPQTDKSGNTTVCCLECGRRLPYDWANMRRGV